MDVNEMIQMQKKLVPEMFDLIEKRYNILLNILYYQPIGRRTLASKLHLGERIVRTETNKLQEEDLIEIHRQGMMVTDLGNLVIEKLQQLIHEIRGLHNTEIKAQEILALDNMITVPGNVDMDPKTLASIGNAAAEYIKSILKHNMIIGVTGGWSVFSVAQEMNPIKSSNILVVPARGGMGREANSQANNIAAQLAAKLQGNYELLHIPDDVGGKILEALKTDPKIKHTLETLKKLDILIFGIGRADIMAEKRGLSQEKRDFLKEKSAVAEAFGHYFDKNGNVIYRSSSVGISIENFKEIPYVIAVAGGAKKAQAIGATCKIRKDLMLVTDESAIQAIIEDYKNN